MLMNRPSSQQEGAPEEAGAEVPVPPIDYTFWVASVWLFLGCLFDNKIMIMNTMLP